MAISNASEFQVYAGMTSLLHVFRTGSWDTSLGVCRTIVRNPQPWRWLLTFVMMCWKNGQSKKHGVHQGGLQTVKFDWNNLERCKSWMMKVMAVILQVHLPPLLIISIWYYTYTHETFHNYRWPIHTDSIVLTLCMTVVSIVLLF